MTASVRNAALTAADESTISAVIFDLGNVVVGWDPYLPFADRMSMSQWQEFTREADFAGLNTMADHGVPLNDVIERAEEQNLQHGVLIRHYYEHFQDSLTGPVHGVAGIIRELHATGLRVLGLTNWSAETYHHALDSAPVISELETVVVSGREGIAKPDPLLFLRMAEVHHLTPQRTVFVDDTPHNVEAASALGFIALRFSEATQLRKDLRRLGGLA